MGCFYFEHFVFVMCFVTDCQRGSLLGSKTLGTNVLELQFVICWQTMIKIQSLGLGLLKVCLIVKLESSDCRNYWTKFARLDRSKIRFNRSKHVQIYFLQKFQFSPNPFDLQGFVFYSKYKRKNLSYVLEVFGVLCVESFVRSRGVYLHTHTQSYQDQDLRQELNDLFSCCIMNFKEDLKHLSAVSKSQVGELMVATN